MLYLIYRYQLLWLFSVKSDKIWRLKIVIEIERTSKQLWLVETLSVNSLVDIYEKEMTGCELAEIESGTSGNQTSKGTSIFIYLHKMTSAFMSVRVHHRGHTLTIAVLIRSLQAFISL